MPDIIELINREYSEMTPKQKRICEYTTKNIMNVSRFSLKEFSAKTEASELTILKLCRKMGYSGFAQFKEAVQNHIEGLVSDRISNRVLNENNRFPSQNSKTAFLQEIAQSYSERFNAFWNEFDVSAVEAAAKEILKANRIFLCGHGTSKVLISFIECRLGILGITTQIIDINDVGYTHGKLAMLRQDDLLIITSFKNYYPPITDLARYAQVKDTPVICLTDSVNNPCLQYSKNHFITPMESDFFYNSLAIPISVLNLLGIAVSVEMGERYHMLKDEIDNVSKYIKNKNVLY